MCFQAKSGPALNEGYTERGINTFNDAPKHKNVQTERILHSEQSTFASTWDLHDTYTALQGTVVVVVVIVVVVVVVVVMV